jgi:hypothetical protein
MGGIIMFVWFSDFRGEDLNVIFYQNMPNLHNRYKSADRKISQKNPEYMLNYSLNELRSNIQLMIKNPEVRNLYNIRKLQLLLDTL